MPTARADTATTNANTAVKIAVLANEAGTSLTILSVTTPANGTARINTDKTITYTPRDRLHGQRLVPVHDPRRCAGRGRPGRSPSPCATERPSPPPTAPPRMPAQRSTIAVLANDSDPDGHALSVSAVTQPTNGAAAINADKTITYTPRAGLHRQRQLHLHRRRRPWRHGAGVTVAVTVRNRPPLAAADAAVDRCRRARSTSPCWPTTTTPTATR